MENIECNEIGIIIGLSNVVGIGGMYFVIALQSPLEYRFVHVTMTNMFIHVLNHLHFE